MSSKTTNYNLHKIDLNDSPPDITVLNDNFDAIDETLHEVETMTNSNNAPTYSAASSLTNLTSGEKLSVAMGKIKKAITDLIAHIGNKSNPHSVTKSQVGLGSVDNTSDANKPVSTAQATAIADAKSAGTTAQSNLSTHTSNKSNPHGVTAAQVGAVPTTRKVNGKALSSDITLSSADVGAPSASLHNITLNMDTFSSLVFSDTDFNTNMGVISEYMDTKTGSEMWEWRYPMAGSSGFVKSIHAKILADIGLTTNGYCDVEIKKFNTNTVQVFVYPQVADFNGMTFYCTYRISGNTSTTFAMMTHPDGFVPADGTTAVRKQNIWLYNGYGRLYTATNLMQMEHYSTPKDSTERSVFYISHAQALDANAVTFRRYTGGSNKAYRIFGEHNKPNGSYTGNGSSTSRTINVDGIGNLLCIRGNGATALVSDSGAIVFTQSGTTITKIVGSEIKFEDGVLTIATVNTGLNKSGLVYNYRLL